MPAQVPYPGRQHNTLPFYNAGNRRDDDLDSNDTHSITSASTHRLVGAPQYYDHSSGRSPSSFLYFFR